MSQDVEFTYPSRPNTQILHGLSIEAKPGTTIALVGPSGCGKSTVIALIERWYDIDNGTLKVDHIEVRDHVLPRLRESMALVGQEPVLYFGTIKDNIAYGAIGDASMSEIENVARTSNIHDFIMSLPDGYNTMVGEKGTQLSGGQK